MTDGDMAEVQSQLHYPSSLINAVVHKGPSMPHYSVLPAQAQRGLSSSIASFTRFSCGCRRRFSATALLLLDYSSFSPMVWHEINQRERRRRRKRKKFHESWILILFTTIFLKSQKDTQYTLGPPRYLLKEIKCGRQSEAIRRRKKGKGGREERKEEQKESEIIFREQNFPQLGVTLYFLKGF